MTAHIVREARAMIPKASYERELPALSAIIQIDGASWFSASPANAGEAVSINQDAERIVEAVKRV